MSVWLRFFCRTALTLIFSASAIASYPIATTPAVERLTTVKMPVRHQQLDDWADKEYAKRVLFSVSELETGDARAGRVLEQVIECESGWSHYWEPFRTPPALAREGEVKVSKGNVGFAQLNASVWRDWFMNNLGYNIYDPTDNLRAAVVLYSQQGLAPWEPWSGHCFVPKLKTLGIY